MPDKTSKKNIIEGNASAGGNIHVGDVYRNKHPTGPEKPDHTKQVWLSVLSGVIGIGIGFLGELMPDNLKTSFEAWVTTNLDIEYWKFWLVLAIIFTLTSLWLIWREAIETSQRKTSAKDFVPEIRDWLLKRYQQRLDQKMAGRLPINLRRIDFSESAAQIAQKQFKEIPPEIVEAELTHFFKTAEGRLLIVGAPGAGKTTLLLQLAAGLLDTELDTLPVVLNLATWSKDFTTLEQWLLKLLPIELGVNNSLAKKILEESRLVFLFDGLDEIPDAEQRTACLAAIDLFVSPTRPRRKFVISSRTQEFRDAQRVPMISFPIEVGTLTMDQIERELTCRDPAQPEDRDLLAALQSDTLLRDAAETPFYFNCLQLMFSEGKRPAFTATDRAGREREILDAFVENELSKCKKPESEKWLAFLAENMKKNKIIKFQLTDLQYEWLKNKNFIYALFYRIISSSIMLFIFMMICFSFYFFYFSKILNFFSVTKMIIFIILLFSWRDANKEITIRGEWNFLNNYSSAKLLINVIFENVEDKKNWNNQILMRTYLVAGLVLLAAAIIFFKLLYMVLGNLVLTIFMFIFATMFSLLFYYSNYIPIVVSPIAPYQMFLLSAKNFHFSIIQHFLLRYKLFTDHYLPFNIVEYLDSISNIKSKNNKYTYHSVYIMETDGASWRFRHRLIQEWFAEKWTEEHHK